MYQLIHLITGYIDIDSVKKNGHNVIFRRTSKTIFVKEYMVNLFYLEQSASRGNDIDFMNQ